MAESFLEKIPCPNCNHPIAWQAHLTPAGLLHCDACGNEVELRAHVCPYCGTYHPEALAYCRQCGSPLTRRCPHCGASNWIGDPRCLACAQTLDVVELIIRRHTLETGDRLYAQMDEAQAMKEREEAASAARMARMQEEERQQRAELQRALEARRDQERKLLAQIAIAVIVILLLIIIANIISAL